MNTDQEKAAWCIRFDHYDPEDEGRRESLLALGNGYLVSRAAAPESAEDPVHYPGTYRVGCYNELTSTIEGRQVKNESMVNLPNWLPLTFRVEGGEWFSLEKVTILDYCQVLDMQQGLLSRTVHFRDGHGRETRLRERRLVSMAGPHLMALAVEITAVNWSGTLEVRTGLDGRVANNKVKRYAPYNNRHLEILGTEAWEAAGLELRARTTQSNITVALAARTTCYLDGRPAPAHSSVQPEPDRITRTLRVPVAMGQTAMVEKVAVLHTSLHLPAEECSPCAREALREVPGFDALLKEHREAWAKLWDRCPLHLDDPDQLCRFRLHVFHILQNFSPHTIGLDAGVAPSGWQGEEYHGQVFWDELFLFPFLTFHFPESARALLGYRYRRLGAARKLAATNGYRGAMFPWRSASDGSEETPPFQLYPPSGHWVADHTCLQRHIGAIIAYNVWYYGQVTGDAQFMADGGAELFLEIARFWGSIARYNEALDRYEIHGVAGPDEYHTKDPDTQTPGLRNNTYTNLMAAWTLSQAREIFDALPAEKQRTLRESLDLRPEEFDHWEAVSRKMRIVFCEDGTLSQFEGFDRLPPLDWKKFQETHGGERLDWALEAAGDSVERYRVSKQADTPLLLYLFTPAQLLALLERLGYAVDLDVLRRTLSRHLSHTAHESSLSKVVYAGAFAALDRPASWAFFEQAQGVDLSPGDKGTAEGIHLGAMGGTLAVLLHHYLGLKVHDGVLEVQPNLPEALAPVRLTLRFRGATINLRATRTAVTLQPAEHPSQAISVRYGDAVQELRPGQSLTFRYPAAGG